MAEENKSISTSNEVEDSKNTEKVEAIEKVEEVKEEAPEDKSEDSKNTEDKSDSEDSKEKPEEVKEEKKEAPKKKKEDRIGILNIYTTFNNTVMNLTDMSGKSLAKFSGGQSTKQDRLKANPTIAMFIAQRIAEEAKDNGLTCSYKVFNKSRI
jgi:small subunit ribosomal protein S11